MDPRALLDLLAARRPVGLPPGELAIRPVQENVFELKVQAHQTGSLEHKTGSLGGSSGAGNANGNAGSMAGGIAEQHFFVKWIAEDNLHGQNELRIARIFKHLKVLPAPPLLFEQPVEGGLIAGWAWISGHDLRVKGRDQLPAAFARLGQLHKAMRNSAEIVSPLGSKPYANPRALLAEESYRLTAPFGSPVREHCLAILARLEVGYPTLTHGDMHPGNFIATDERIWIVDWSYACNSLNLFDLDYVQSIALPPSGPAWTVIDPPEAQEVLRAYFQAAGMEQVDCLKVHRAVMVWNQLRIYDNCVQNGYRTEAGQARQNLLDLLEH